MPALFGLQTRVHICSRQKRHREEASSIYNEGGAADVLIESSRELAELRINALIFARLLDQSRSRLDEPIWNEFQKVLVRFLDPERQWKVANFSQNESKYFKISKRSASGIRGPEGYQYYDKETNEPADDENVQQVSNDRNGNRLGGSIGKASYIDWARKLQKYLNDQKEVHQTSFEESYPSQNSRIQTHVPEHDSPSISDARHGRLASSHPSTFSHFDTRVDESLLSLYMASVHHIFPILYDIELQNLRNLIRHDRHGIDEVGSTILYLTLAIARRHADLSGNYTSTPTHQQLFTAAFPVDQSLPEYFSESTPSLRQVQIIGLLAFYKMCINQKYRYLITCT